MTFLAQSARVGVLVAAIAALIVGCGGGGGGPDAQGGPPMADVSVAQVVKKSVREWDEFTGRIEATDTVEIRPRASGYLSKIHFREGGEVAKGDLLFSIDDREYRAALASGKANVARAKARAALAQANFKRSERLATAKAVSQEELQAANAELTQAEADVASAQAALVQSELNVEFTEVRAPISGRVGQALIREGNLITAGQTLLTTLVSLDQVYVYFDGDEQVYLRYQTLSRDGSRPSSRDSRNPVRVGLANETGYPHTGEMDFVDNQLNPTTGTIRARALLDNKDRIFTPGLFARLQLLGSGEFEARLIHDLAVLTDQDRKYVYVVGPNSIALRKEVKLGREVDGLRVVESGLEDSDIVVVNGTRKIFFPGMGLKTFTVPMDQPTLPPPPPPGAPGAPGAPAKA
jgi:membrane fusion protein, multidrug efflux system